MNAMNTVRKFAAIVVLGLAFGGSANAADILCMEVANNHMLVADTTVSACLDAGVGNLTGNPANDLFLTGVGTDYASISKSDALNPFNITYDTAGGNPGSFSFDASAWNAYSAIAIGFKFGTGNTPDEWFVYSLVSGVSQGAFNFIDVLAPGKATAERLSHINLYGIPSEVPEPGTLVLLGFALAGFGVMRRRMV